MASMRVNYGRVPTEVMYLIVIDRLLKNYRDVILQENSENFQNMVRQEVMAHVVDGKQPPEAIHTAVLNVADDMMAGRDVVLRSGDYIALMNYARDNKLV